MVSRTALLAALSSTGLISLAPNLILLAFPQFGRDSKGQAILTLGQALAAGGLLGDVFLHTLSHTTNYEKENVGFWILLGFVIFLIVDMTLRATGHDHSHHGGGAHHHQPSHGTTNKTTKENGVSSSTSSKDILLTPTILLNMAADALHNFTDGLAIGASFATIHSDTHNTFASLMASRGGLATISILFHEIPHELGDYCVLLKGGFTKSQAIVAQFVTAVAAMVGTLVGLWAAGWGSHSMVYLTSGGFVYLSCVNILPEVLEEQGSATFRLAQLCAFLSGLAFMYAVLFLEAHDHHHDEFHHDHHHHHHHGVHSHDHTQEEL